MLTTRARDDDLHGNYRNVNYRADIFRTREQKYDPVRTAIGFICISNAYATTFPSHNHEFISDR